MAIYGLVFAYHQKENGELDAQTIRRCDEAAFLYHLGKLNYIFLTAKVEKNGVLMKEAMRERLIEKGVNTSHIITDGRGSNTASELVVFKQHLERLEGHYEVMLISSWYHIPRIAWFALWRLPNQPIKFVPVWRVHAKPVGDVLMEIPKLALALAFPFGWRKVAPMPPAS